MKLFTITLLMLLALSQLNIAQNLHSGLKLNAMSDVFGVTAEGGATIAKTDYLTFKPGYIFKGSLEYYFPSTVEGNFGIKIWGQSGLITAKDPYPVFANPTNEFKTNIGMIGGGIIYTFSVNDIVYPWAGLGVSNLWFYPKDANGNKLPGYVAGNYPNFELVMNIDAGVRFMLSKNLSANISGGMVIGRYDYLDDIRIGKDNDYFGTVTAGMSYYFGREKDSDGDGVPDNLDQCPDTPLGVKVDNFGCPIDSDGDGVPDYLDKCPNTPTGIKVDASGCPLDSDGDGIPDYLDKCPDTPHGVKVDAHGCLIDSDGDGVPDYLDKCPNTPKGTKVDANGCPILKEEFKHFTLSGDANFNSGKSDLLSVAFPILDKLADAMKNNPNYKWIVEGYTDSKGKDALNLKLSEKRAQAVVDYLVSKGAYKNNFSIKALGKANPVADNKTEQGRAKNRRVEIKIVQ
jgi:outer membrane protein OmpA-like peptidoglycan-associated protein